MNDPHPTSRRFLVLLVGMLCNLTFTQAGEQWFPNNGPAAIHQRCMDLANPAVAMVVALQPSYEDLPLMAYLRAQCGAKTVVVFLTNGEATPGDSLARYPAWMTGERKLEANRAASLLDAEAWFANIPDFAGAASAAELEAVWDSAGARKRLVRAIRTYKPDVLTLCPDRRAGEMESLRDKILEKTVREAVAAAATTADTSRSGNLLPWKVQRIFVQHAKGTIPTVFEKRHPFFKISPLDMARAAGQEYRTLRLAMPDRMDERRDYHVLAPAGLAEAATSPDGMLKNLPRISGNMADVGKAIRKAIRSDSRGIRSATLAPVSGAIDAAEHVIVHQSGKLSTPDQRLMVTWKNGLEALRCAVLDVTVTVTATESLLTANQLWYLNVKPVKPLAPRQGSTEIIFPLASDGEWVVNESLSYHFPLDSATKFSVLSPSELPFTVPSAEYGLAQPAMSTRFSYVVVHKDVQRERNYMYHGAVALQFGPRRSFALRTPLVFDDPRSPVIVEMQNFSRDKFKGILTLSDTSGNTTQAPLVFERKDEIVTDTLFVPGTPADEDGRRLLTVELSGRGDGGRSPRYGSRRWSIRQQASGS